MSDLYPINDQPRRDDPDYDEDAAFERLEGMSLEELRFEASMGDEDANELVRAWDDQNAEYVASVMPGGAR